MKKKAIALLLAMLTGLPGCGPKRPAEGNPLPENAPTAAAMRPSEPIANMPARAPGPMPEFSPGDIAAGKVLAGTYCQSCHLLPQPESLDKKTWYYSALPNMSPLLGRYMKAGSAESLDQIPEDWYEPGEGGQRVRAARVFPSSPVVSAEQWRQLVAYYVSEAPEKPLPIENPLMISTADFPFRIHRFPVGPDYSPTVSCVKITSGGNQILVGDSNANTLRAFDKAGRQLAKMAFSGPPVQIDELSKNLFVVTDIGSFIANDRCLGKLMLVKQDPDSGKLSAGLVLDKMPRPVHTTFADLNGDGQSDIVISAFGRWLGNLSWYENTPGGLVPHRLDDLPGNLNNYVADMDHDGLPDIVVLRSHGDEGIFIYKNKGKGEFDKRTVARFPPSYGCNYMELADFNKDGYPDILMTCGDNGDYPPILKKYHGIRLFINQQDGTFKQEQFFPMCGAVRAKAFDYDLDGDLDLVAISYFSDFSADLKASFALLENLGKEGFVAHTFADADAGRWLSMDVGDIDGDGDPDIVLGAYDTEEDLPPALRDRWRAHPQSVIWLENLAK